MNIKNEIHEMGRRALAASRVLATLPADRKNAALGTMADSLLAATRDVLAANAKDIANAGADGLPTAMIDRLRLDPERLGSVADGIRQVAALPDPVGDVLDDWQRPNGIHIQQLRVPIGVIGIIFESRPNVTSDAAVLCLKAGNATILRGGKEAIHSNRAIAAALRGGCSAAGLPADCIQLIPFTERESVRHMAEMDAYLDLIIPRGGAGLIEAVVSMARMPVIKHYDGICHLYAHAAADPAMALALTVDSKTQKPGVCNALETLLVDSEIAGTFLPAAAAALSEKGVELRACPTTLAILGDRATAADEADWRTEYLDLILSVKVVDGLGAAVQHINEYSSHHTDCIVTADDAAADRFLAEVDSAAVFWNVSTRFSDGEEFGFGAEIGISTDKLHARGPMGLRELTSYKYLVRGNGQTKTP